MAMGASLARRLERHLYRHGICEAIAFASCTFWLLFVSEKRELPALVSWVLPLSSLGFLLVAPILALAGVVSALWYAMRKETPVSSAIPRVVVSLVFLWAWWQSTVFFELP